MKIFTSSVVTPSNEVEGDLFKALGLNEPLLKALKRQKYEKPTAIQAKTIPLALAGKDIIACSATGSGKTLAFGAGIIQNARKGEGLQALILTPTRELAEQVANSLRTMTTFAPLNIASVYGGVNIKPQFVALRNADIVVGTPGRILDHQQRRTINFSKLKTLVLDEADTMFDMGFIKDVEKIISFCPKERQTLLFSATMNSEIIRLTARHTRDAVKVMATSYVDPKKLTQICYDVSLDLKFSLLVHLLKNEESQQAMVFCNTRHSTDKVARNLQYSGIEARAIHGGFSQEKRNKTIKHFYAKKVSVLICTDVAARGLDIAGVSHVYNYEVPADFKQYIHRIGRTARAGKDGKAISLLSNREQGQFPRALKNNAIAFAKAKLPSIERALTCPPQKYNAV